MAEIVYAFVLAVFCLMEQTLFSHKVALVLSLVFTKLSNLQTKVSIYMSRIVRKRDYCLCENKGADQLRSNCEADQRLCFRYSDSTIPLLLKYEISSF